MNTTIGRDIMEHQQPPASPCHFVAIPYPGRGHINPMMNLCKRLASKKPDILISFLVTEEWFGFIGDQPLPHNVVLDTIPNVIMSELVRARDLTSFIEEVSTKMEAAVEEVLDQLIQPPDLIIVDSFLCWGVPVGKRRSIPVASFWPMAASVISYFLHFHLLQQNGHFPFDLSEKADEVVDYIPGISPTRLGDLPDVINEQVLQRTFQVTSGIRMAQYLLVASIYELEKQSFDALREELPFPVYAIGTCIPNSRFLQDSDKEKKKMNFSAHSSDHHRYLQWLDSQPNSSVLYVSHGSFLSIPTHQMDEIAQGLQESGVRVLWVAREESSRLKELLGPGTTTRILTVAWSDQLRVLSHPAIGGFWTHCGWNSIKEGVFAGVPFLTFPLGMDQLLNSKRVVDDWKIGWRVTDCTWRSIAGVVQRFMDLDLEETREMRRRAKQVQELCHLAVEEDGSSEADINEFALRF